MAILYSICHEELQIFGGAKNKSPDRGELVEPRTGDVYQARKYCYTINWQRWYGLSGSLITTQKFSGVFLPKSAESSGNIRKKETYEQSNQISDSFHDDLHKFRFVLKYTTLSSTVNTVLKYQYLVFLAKLPVSTTNF